MSIAEPSLREKCQAVIDELDDRRGQIKLQVSWVHPLFWALLNYGGPPPAKRTRRARRRWRGRLKAFGRTHSPDIWLSNVGPAAQKGTRR